MLQRSKPQKSSRRPASPAKAAGAEGSATAAVVPVPAAEATAPVPVPEVVAEAVAAVIGESLSASAPALQAESSAPGHTPAVETAAPAPVAAAEPATPGPVPVVETAPPGPVPVVETAPPGPIPVVETAPPGPAGAGETESVQASVGAGPSDQQPRIGALFAPRIMTMEIPMQQANKAAETMMKAAEEAAEFGRGNVEAFTKATQIYVAGVQDLGKQTFAVVQGLADHAMEGAKALSGVKSLQEAVQIQSTFARAAIEKSVSEGAKIGESALKLTEQTFAPITARMSLAAEKLTKVPAVA